MITNAKILAANASPEDYHKPAAERGNPAFVMSSGQLRDFDACPSRWKAGYEFAGSEATKWGSLVDCKLLTPYQTADRYAVRPPTYLTDGMECPKCKTVTGSMKCKACGVPRVPIRIEKEWNANADECKAWLALNAHMELVTSSELEEANKAIARLRADETIAAFLDCSDKQVHVTATWQDDETGLEVPLKALVDLLPRPSSEFAKCIGDLKTTRNAKPMPWQRWCFQAGYHVQAALYADMVMAAEGGSDRNTFVFILSESFPPYQPAKRMGGQGDGNIDGFLDFGRKEYQRMLKNYCRCLKTGFWPGYDDTDEAVQGWSIIRPEPFMLERAAFAPKYEFGEAEEEAPAELQDPDDFQM